MDKTGTCFSNNIYNNKYMKTWSLRLSTFSAKPKLMLAYSESIYHCCVLSWIQCFKCVFKFWRPYISLPMCKCFVDSLFIIVRNKTSTVSSSFSSCQSQANKSWTELLGLDFITKLDTRVWFMKWSWQSNSTNRPAPPDQCTMGKLQWEVGNRIFSFLRE